MRQFESTPGHAVLREFMTAPGEFDVANPSKCRAYKEDIGFREYDIT